MESKPTIEKKLDFIAIGWYFVVCIEKLLIINFMILVLNYIFLKVQVEWPAESCHRSEFRSGSEGRVRSKK